MDQEIKELIRRNIKITEENNVLLRKMHRSAVWASFFRAIYWIIIIATGAVSFYFAQPYLDKAMTLYADLQSGVSTVKNFGSFGQ